MAAGPARLTCRRLLLLVLVPRLLIAAPGRGRAPCKCLQLQRGVAYCRRRRPGPAIAAGAYQTRIQRPKGRVAVVLPSEETLGKLKAEAGPRGLRAVPFPSTLFPAQEARLELYRTSPRPGGRSYCTSCQAGAQQLPKLQVCQLLHQLLPTLSQTVGDHHFVKSSQLTRHSPPEPNAIMKGLHWLPICPGSTDHCAKEDATAQPLCQPPASCTCIQPETADSGPTGLSLEVVTRERKCCLPRCSPVPHPAPPACYRSHSQDSAGRPSLFRAAWQRLCGKACTGSRPGHAPPITHTPSGALALPGRW